MRKIETEIIIEADINKIWSILTDFDKYPNWNPFIKSIVGNIAEGEKFKVVLEQPDSKAMTFKPTCIDFKKNRRFSWLGHLGFPGLFDGHHIFELTDLGNGKIKFEQNENFKGLLVPLFWGQLDTKTRLGFTLMNEKLKELSEKE